MEYISANLASGFTSVYTGGDGTGSSKKLPSNFVSILTPSRGNEDLKAVAALAAANVKTQKAQRPYKQNSRQDEQHSLSYSMPLALTSSTTNDQQQQQMSSSISADQSLLSQAIASTINNGDLPNSTQTQMQTPTPPETSEHLSPTDEQVSVLITN